MIATDGGLDFDLLSLRIHPAASRIAKLAAETPASFVAFDLLAEGDDDLRERPFRERRARLEQLMADAAPPVLVTPATTDRALAEEWFERFEGAGLDGVVAKPLDGPYLEGKRTMQKVKHQRTADCVVGGYREHKDGGVGSLLLGLFDDAGRAAPRRRGEQLRGAAARGVARGARAVPRRRARRPPVARLGGGRRRCRLRPGSAGRARRAGGPAARTSAGSRCASSWSPRSRTSTCRAIASATPPRFARWRPDREPASCTYAQLDVPVPMELREIFGL